MQKLLLMAFSLCSVINYGSSNTGVLFIKLRIILQQKLIKILYLPKKYICKDGIFCSKNIHGNMGSAYKFYPHPVDI